MADESLEIQRFYDYGSLSCWLGISKNLGFRLCGEFSRDFSECLFCTCRFGEMLRCCAAGMPGLVAQDGNREIDERPPISRPSADADAVPKCRQKQNKTFYRRLGGSQRRQKQGDECARLTRMRAYRIRLSRVRHTLARLTCVAFAGMAYMDAGLRVPGSRERGLTRARAHAFAMRSSVLPCEWPDLTCSSASFTCSSPNVRLMDTLSGRSTGKSSLMRPSCAPSAWTNTKS